MIVDRPLWRAFGDRARAEQHVRAGGIAVIGTTAIVPTGLFGVWAVRALESPPVRLRSGLMEVTIPRDWRERVAEWLDRDTLFAGATTQFRFDCTRCAACCHENHVVTSKEDRERFAKAGLPRLRVLPARGADKVCIYLDGLRCSIYEARPFMCREFPAGTEHCLTSREEVYGSPFFNP